jgi:hypothetical protein
LKPSVLNWHDAAGQKTKEVKGQKYNGEERSVGNVNGAGERGRESVHGNSERGQPENSTSPTCPYEGLLWFSTSRSPPETIMIIILILLATHVIDKRRVVLLLSSSVYYT